MKINRTIPLLLAAANAIEFIVRTDDEYTQSLEHHTIYNDNKFQVYLIF